MVLQIAFHKVFSHQQKGLGHFEDSNSIPLSQSTTFHPSLIVATLLKYLLLPVERLSQRCHLSRIDEVLKCGDSMKDLHKNFQTPMNCPDEVFLFDDSMIDLHKNFQTPMICPFIFFLACVAVLRTLTNFFRLM